MVLVKSGRTIETASLIAGLVITVGWLWWFLSDRSEPTDAPVRQVSERENPPLPNLDFAPSASGPSTDEDSSVVAPEGGEGEPEGAIAGQRIWQVSDVDAAVTAAEAAGLEVLGVIRELGQVRVAGEAALLDAARPTDAEESFVFPVSTPGFPLEETVTIEGLAPFLDAALEKIGITERNPDWGKGVRIALLDTGVSAHPALANALIRGVLEDGNGHGTAMASILVGTDAYVQGLSPAAELISIPVLDASGQGDTFQLADGIVSAVNAGAQVISLSAGSYTGSTALESAVDYASSKGVLIVAAPGNDGAELVRYPAAYDAVVAANPIDANGSKPSFANFGNAVDLSAPGVTVYTAWEGETYVAMSGSSASTPFVASAVAMLMSENPAWTPQQAYAALQANANDLGKPGVDPVFGAGSIDLGRTLRNAAGSATDLAVMPPYVALDEATAETAPVYLSLQNRGTETLASTRLDLVVDGISYTYTVGTLAPGESGGVQIPLSLARLAQEGGLKIESSAFLPGSEADADPANDTITATLRLPADDAEAGGGG
jgi:hypothetical protein